MPNTHETQRLEFVLHLKNIVKKTDNIFLKERLRALISKEVEKLSEAEYEFWKFRYSVIRSQWGCRTPKFYKEYIVGIYQICINNKNEFIYKKCGVFKESKSFSPEDSWRLAGLNRMEKVPSIGSLHNKKVQFYDK